MNPQKFLLLFLLILPWKTEAQLVSDFHVRQITFGGFHNAHPVFSRDNETILFDSDRNGKRQFYSIHINDSIPELILQDTLELFMPALRPYGEVAFGVKKNSEIWLPYESKNSRSFKLLEKRKVQMQFPDFNEAGNLIAFSGKNDNDKYWKLMTYDFRYDNLNEVVKASEDISFPRWSPKGLYLSFHREKENAVQSGFIEIIHWNGSPQTQISNDTLQLSQANWGSSVNKVTCIGKNEKGYWLLIVSTDGKNIIPVAFSKHKISRPDWSSDGRYIVASISEYTWKQELFLIDLDFY
jgi:Tol biopolymer transport system component